MILARWTHCVAIGSSLALIAAMGLVIVSGCNVESPSPGVSASNNTTSDSRPATGPLPQRGKVKQPFAPARAVFGMIYVNTINNREYIFDGAEWVPHDYSVDAYYIAKASSSPARMPSSEVFPTDTTPYPPAPTGAHGKHAGFSCKACHVVGGVLCFDRTGPAVASGKPLPSFNATDKTCSNVACHGVPAGTFSYYFPGGDGEPVLNTVSYGGTLVATTPSWNATGVGCAACHGNPPANGSDGSNVWHSGYHTNAGPTDPANQCQFCHPDAYSPNTGHGTTITNQALHGNGTVEVQAKFTSSCFGCH